ncbi:MAG: class I SAM-dependent methyltransferase [Candidatus Hydrogenedentota bacterium]|nr:MAG: class I SAM-dependent methyltransferase [Candidatus Hydrogenedentota bacterium]
MSRFRNCPLCHSDEHRVLYKGLKDRFYGLYGIFDIVECKRCQFRFLGVPPPNLSEYYPERYYSYQPPSPVLRVLRRLAGRALFYMPKATPGQRLLDFGCGSGDYLEWMKGRGWTVCGIERSEHLAGILNQKEITVFQSIDLLLKTQPTLFDLVTFNSVFEHLEDFRSVLQEVKNLMKIGGEIVILVPNVASREHRIFGSRWFHLDPPRHLWHFSPNSLRPILEEAGFARIHIENVPCPTGFSGSTLYTFGLQFNQILFYLLMPAGYLWSLFIPDGIMRARAERA